MIHQGVKLCVITSRCEVPTNQGRNASNNQQYNVETSHWDVNLELYTNDIYLFLYKHFLNKNMLYSRSNLVLRVKNIKKFTSSKF